MMAKLAQTQIRWMIRADHNLVLDIDHYSYIEEMSYEQLIELLRERAVIGVVSEDAGGNVVGFCIYRLSENGVEVLRMAVMPKHRRCGIGTAMTTRITEKVLVRQRRFAFADVDERSLHAQLLLKSCGFVGKQVGDKIRFRYERGE